MTDIVRGEFEKEISRLEKENKRLTRELDRQLAINKRSKINFEAAENLKRIADNEKIRLDQYMSLLLTNSEDIILLFDHCGKIVYASNSFFRNINVAKIGAIKGKDFDELFKILVPDFALPQVIGLFTRAVLERRELESNCDIDFLDCGTMRHFIIQVTPMLNDDNELECATCMFRDMTDIIRAKDEAEEARRIAERSTLAKSDFLSRMSHEMRTPLNAIIGMIQIACKINDLEKVQYSFSKINEASHHLLGVINDILDISKIEADKFKLYCDDFSFEKMFRQVVSVANFKIEEKQQRFMVFIDQNIPRYLYGDSQRLAQVLTNLLFNAVKFTDELGTIRVNANLVEKKENECRIYIEVIDNGIGISEEQQKDLFLKFEQADGSISRKYGGTGLGLAISEQIVRLMGGELEVKSALGKGATFFFTIPLTIGREPEPMVLHKNAKWNNLRILAVDDSVEICDYFIKIMERLHINCDVAESGFEALDKINQNGGYDIYFVDWRMPGMNGIELSKKIRECETCPSVIIMISATDWNIIADDAKAAGVSLYMPKPFFPSDIIDCINERLGVERHIERDTADKVCSFAGYHAMLVEDIEINREILISLIEPTHLKVDCAANGIEAVQLFAENPEKYDLILMDVQMPEMDGYTATRLIRDIDTPCAKTIPILALTANAFREDIEKCLKVGMNGHISKPINVEEIMTKLKQYLSQGQNAERDGQ